MAAKGGSIDFMFLAPPYPAAGSATAKKVVLFTYLSLSKLNTIESTESIEFVEGYFLVMFIFKFTKISIPQIL